jgi:hypothetical protein
MMKHALIALLLSFVSNISAAGETAEIPFQFTDGFIRVEARVASSQEPLSMLLDSGASVSVLNLETASRLKIPMGKPLTVRGVTSDASACEIASLPSTISGVTAGNIALVADMQHARALCLENVDGLIGANFFRNRIVQIDYGRQCLRILAKSPRSTAGFRLPIKIINDVACAGVGVNGSSLRWARIDTGCNDSLHWVIPKLARSEKTEGASIGFVTDALDLTLARVALGNRFISSVPTALHGHPFFEGEAGLLGNGLLSRFTVTLDWPGRSLILQDRIETRN